MISSKLGSSWSLAKALTVEDGMGRLRGAALAVRHAPDRLLHPLRARRANATLPSLQAGDHVLVLCHGNICRSPYAAAALRDALARLGMADITVDSAGFVGPGRPVPAVGLDLAAARGVDLSTHRSQLLTPALMDGARLVVVMDHSQRARSAAYMKFASPVLLLGDFDDSPIETRAIRDPWSQPAPVFAEVFTRLERCTAALGLGLQAVTARPTVRNGAYSAL